MAGDESSDRLIKPVRIERTFAVDLIRSILTHPRIWEHITDDLSGDPASFDPSTAVEAFYFLLAKEGEDVLGMYVVHQHTSVMFEIHTCLLPKSWGDRAKAAGTAVISWVFENTPCEKLITFVPIYNRLALAYAKRFMKIEGVITKSFRKNGVLHDQYILGIEKGVFVCQ